MTITRSFLLTAVCAAGFVPIFPRFSAPTFGQISTAVSVNFATPIKYANNAVVATMPDTGLGLHTSVYANTFGYAALPGMLKSSGVQLLRYPGGSYSDCYNWATGNGNAGIYVAGQSDFGNFINIMDQAATKGMVTINYGSDSTNTIGGQPQTAAAWVAYANANPNIYGTASDVSLGTDAAGVNWKTAGYWAKLRASTPAQFQSWATTDGVYNSANTFLAINHPAAKDIKYWEIGNEIGGNGYAGGYQWEYDLHAPYNGGNTSDNTGRQNNPLLSPTAYGSNLVAFSDLMKKVDPTIKIGAGFNAGSTNDPADKLILNATNASFPGKKASDYIDFGIIHWYPYASDGTNAIASLPNAVTTGSYSLPNVVNNLRSTVNTNTSKGYNGMEVTVTEFGLNLNVPSGTTYPDHSIVNALFYADAYAQGMQLGVKNMDSMEMSGKLFTGDGPIQPGEVYYTTQLLSLFAGSGDTFVSTAYSDSKLRVYAVKRADGSVAFLFINDGAAANASQDRQLTLNLSGNQALASSGSLYAFGIDQMGGSTIAAPSLQTISGIGSSFTVTIPDQTIGTLVINAVPEPTSLSVVGTVLAALFLRRRLNSI